MASIVLCFSTPHHENNLVRSFRFFRKRRSLNDHFLVRLSYSQCSLYGISSTFEMSLKMAFSRLLILFCLIFSGFSLTCAHRDADSSDGDTFAFLEALVITAFMISLKSICSLVHFLGPLLRRDQTPDQLTVAPPDSVAGCTDVGSTHSALISPLYLCQFPTSTFL